MSNLNLKMDNEQSSMKETTEKENKIKQPGFHNFEVNRIIELGKAKISFKKPDTTQKVFEYDMFAFETKMREVVIEAMEVIHNAAEIDRR